MIKYEDIKNFFAETICGVNSDFSGMNLEGYHCIQMFFLLVNLKAEKLVIQDDDVAMAASGVERAKWAVEGCSAAKPVNTVKRPDRTLLSRAC